MSQLTLFNEPAGQNNIRPFTRYMPLEPGVFRRELLEEVMVNTNAAVFFKTIDAIIESWSDE